MRSPARDRACMLATVGYGSGRRDGASRHGEPHRASATSCCLLPDNELNAFCLPVALAWSPPAMFVTNADSLTSRHPLPFYLEALNEFHMKRGQTFEKGGSYTRNVNLFWVVSGPCAVRVCGEERVLDSGSVFYTLMQDPYRLEMLSDQCHVRIIGFLGPLAEATLLAYSLPRFLVLQRSGEELWQELVRTASSNSELDQRHICALILDFIACVSLTDAEGASDERLMERAKRFIMSHLDDPDLSVDVLCDHLQVSRARLTKSFRQAKLYPPGREILNRRLIRAYALLRGSDYPIATVARKCGFQDPKTFARFIRRASGMGPRDFRETYRREATQPSQ